MKLKGIVNFKGGAWNEETTLQFPDHVKCTAVVAVPHNGRYLAAAGGTTGWFTGITRDCAPTV
ncbi:MAG: hypothetical protein HY319_28900 [Armatimonadetes bacterium]|nr:hypothetical protein [Armatimonadota bacterium]